MANMIFKHHPESFVAGGSRRNGLHRRCHHFLYARLFRISTRQHHSQHDVALAENARETIAVDHHDAAHLRLGHGANGVHYRGSERNSDNGSAEKRHKLPPNFPFIWERILYYSTRSTLIKFVFPERCNGAPPVMTTCWPGSRHPASCAALIGK